MQRTKERSFAAAKFEILNSKHETNSNYKFSNVPNRILATSIGFGHLDFGNLKLPFDLAQGGESFDSAQDREPVERLVEPFGISIFGFRAYSIGCSLSLLCSVIIINHFC
jgi:hypothetical protein